MAARKPVFISFPISVLSSAYNKTAKGSLRPMLRLAYMCHVGMMELRQPYKDGEDFYKRVAKFYGFNSEWVEAEIMEYESEWRFIEACKSNFKRYGKNGTLPYTVMTNRMMADFWLKDAEKDATEKFAFTAYLALRSIVGKRKTAFVKWELLLSRMCGSVGIIPVEEMPESVKRYSTRKMREKLRKALIDKWRVQYLFKGRKPWYCIDVKFNLSEWVATKNPAHPTPQKATDKVIDYLETTHVTYREVEEFMSDYFTDEIELSRASEEFCFTFLPQFGNVSQKWKYLAILWIKENKERYT